MKKWFCLLLVVLLLAAAVPAASADDDVEFTLTLIPSMEYSVSQWMSSETNRCRFAVALIVELGNSNLISIDELDFTRDQFIAYIGNLIVYACGHKNGYLLVIYNNNDGTGLLNYTSTTSSATMKSTIEAIEGTTLYTIDMNTFTSLVQSLAS